jgi:hypothetical protein
MRACRDKLGRVPDNMRIQRVKLSGVEQSQISARSAEQNSNVGSYPRRTKACGFSEVIKCRN